MSQEPNLPRPKDDDSDDVRWALETAQTLWKQNDSSGALRWLARASEMAAHEDADMRALELAKVAAELRNALELPNSLPPPVPAESSASDDAAAEPEALKPAPAAPPPPAVQEVNAPAGDATTEEPPAVEAPPQEALKAPHPSGEESSPTSKTLPGMKAVTGDESEPAPDSSRRARSGDGEATRYIGLRVAVGGLDNEGGLRVRRLAEGELTGDGESLAVLVSLEPGRDLGLL